MKNYTFPTISFRARCTNVVDGDTVDLYVDVGFHSFRQERFRLYGIDTPELRDKRPAKRKAAKAAKDYVFSKLMTDDALFKWTLRVETFRDPDNFGRYLAKIYVMEDNEEICINDDLVKEGHAVYRTY